MNASGQQIWSAVRDAFGRLRGHAARDLWLRDAEPISFHRGLFTLNVASSSAKAAIDARYRDDLESLFLQFTGSPVRVQTRVVDLPASRGPRVDPLPAAPTRFAVTEANGLAHGAVQRFLLSNEPGFNPLFVFGAAGTGKTELGRFALDALLAEGEVNEPLVISGEALARDVNRALRSGGTGELRRGWQACDLVVLDEAHRLRGQRRAQAETVSLLNGVLERGGRALVLSRHAPQDIHGLDARLGSHFLGGMVVPLEEPSTADRKAVLTVVGASLAVPIGADVLDMVAERCPGTLTDAVDMLGRLAAEAAAEGVPLEAELARRRLRHAQPGAASMDALLDQVSRELDVAVTRICSADKSRDVAVARHLVVYLATRSLGMSARQVCRHLGLRSPSVAAYARRQVERRRRLDRDFDRVVLMLQARLDGAQRDIAW